MAWTEDQRNELLHHAKHAPLGYVQVKSLAVWNVACGKPIIEVAKLLAVSRASVGEWVKRYLTGGIDGLVVKKGRGRRPRAQREEIDNYLRQSPKHFGLQQTRWTLRVLAQTVPSLKGFTNSGVYRALVRSGYRYKRGQPHDSPDPLYAEKRGFWSKPLAKQGRILER